MDDQEKWPRKSFGTAIEKLRGSTLEIDESLNPDIEDITTQPGIDEEIVRNAPIIDVVGSEIRAELRSKIWGGTLVRVLERKDQESGRRERCFQYLYLFTHQRGGVSVFWNILVPGLALLFAYYSPTILGYFGGIIWYLATLVLTVCIPLWLFPVMQHVMDWRDHKKTEYHIRGTTLLAPFGLFSWLTVFYFHATTQDMLYQIGFITYAGLILFLVVLIFEYFLCFIGIGITCHRMDYAPIFLYYRESPDNIWTLESACWDYYHHYAVFEDDSTEIVDKENRIRLIMSDLWHSFSRKTFINKTPATIFGLILIVIGAAQSYMANMMSYPSELLSTGLLTFITGTIIFVQRPTGGKQFSDFSKMSESSYLSDRGSLTKSKLDILWNLKQYKARLKITKSLQEPFEFLTTRRESFNDIESKKSSESAESPIAEDEVAESQTTIDIGNAEPEVEIEAAEPESIPTRYDDANEGDSKRLRIDPSRRLGYRPEDEENQE